MGPVRCRSNVDPVGRSRVHPGPIKGPNAADQVPAWDRSRVELEPLQGRCGADLVSTEGRSEVDLRSEVVFRVGLRSVEGLSKSNVESNWDRSEAEPLLPRAASDRIPGF